MSVSENKTRLLDFAMGGASYAAFLAFIAPDVAETELQGMLDELVEAGHLTVTTGPDPIWERPRAAILDARTRALGLATKDGTTSEALADDHITIADIRTLVASKLIVLGKQSGGLDGPWPVHLAVGAEEKIWQQGARALCASTLPPVKSEPEDPLQAAILLALYKTDEWAKTEAIQEIVNATRLEADPAAEHVAVQVIEQTLTEMHAALLVDVEATEPKRWRESAVRVIARRAALLRLLLPGDGEAELEDLLRVLGVPNVALDQDVGALTDAGFLDLGEDRVGLVRENGIPAVLVFVATELVRRQRNMEAVAPEVAQAYAQEIAQWRESHAVQRRRADDLARWLRKHGLEESDVLDQERGTVRPAVAKGEPFEFTESRKVDAAEKGEILGEILELEGQVALLKLELMGTVETTKGRIKTLESEMRDLKNAAACNQRVVSIPAYRRTDWDAGKVFIHAEADDRELSVEDLPKGAQRTIPGTEKVAGEPGPASAEAVEKFAEAMKAKGYTVATPNGVEHIPPARAPITSMEQLDQILSIVLAAHFVARGLGMSELQLAEDMPKGYAIEIPHEGGGPWPLARSIRGSLGRLKRAGVALEVDGVWVPGKVETAHPPMVVRAKVAEGAGVKPEAGEPGPLASTEQRAEHAKKPRGSKKKATEATAP